MILQRNVRVAVYGWAETDEKISVKFLGQVYETKTNSNGKWYLKMRHFKPGGPYSMFIKDGKSTLQFRNIWIGDVWLASGQSNMEFGMQTEKHGQEAIRIATDSLIHFFYVPMCLSLHPVEDISKNSIDSLNGRWVVCSPSLMANPHWAWHGFSAIGYYYALQLRKSTGVSIGMIGSYRGGTPVQAWMSIDRLKKKPEFSKYISEHQNNIDSSKLNSYYDGGLKGPGNCFNGVIAPLVGFNMRGVIWYQGETNGDKLEDAFEYRSLFPELINDWREQWREGNFPFLFIQLPNFRDPAQTASEGNWPWVREGQQKALSLKNTGMVVITDKGEVNDVHPSNKLDPANRLVLVARHNVYGEKLVYSGPLYKSMKVHGDKIIIQFYHTHKGLATPDDKKLVGFGIAGADKKFLWAEASIVGNTVVVSNDLVLKPVAVRYNWADNPPGNLYNIDGLPAAPFRTDHWSPFKIRGNDEYQ